MMVRIDIGEGNNDVLNLKNVKGNDGSGEGHMEMRI